MTIQSFREKSPAEMFAHVGAIPCDMMVCQTPKFIFPYHLKESKAEEIHDMFREAVRISSRSHLAAKEPSFPMKVTVFKGPNILATAEWSILTARKDP